MGERIVLVTGPPDNLAKVAEFIHVSFCYFAKFAEFMDVSFLTVIARFITRSRVTSICKRRMPNPESRK